MLYKVTGAGHSVCVCVCLCVWVWVCVGGGQSSVVRGVREGRGGGQGREGVQLPDSLMDEAVLQSVGPGLVPTVRFWKKTR